MYADKQHKNHLLTKSTCPKPTNIDTHTHSLVGDHQGRDKPYLRVKQRAGALVF